MEAVLREFFYTSTRQIHQLPLTCRSPLVWIVVPLIAGYLLGDRLFGICSNPLWPALTGLLFTFLALLSSSKNRKNANFGISLWPVYFSLSVFFLAFSWFHLRTPMERKIRSGFPMREVSLHIEVQHIFDYQDEYGYCHGLATITGTPVHLRDYREYRLMFRLDADALGKPIVRNSVIEVTGLLTQVENQTDASGFDEYLDRKGIRFILDRGKIKAFHDEAGWFYQQCTSLYFRFKQFLSLGAPVNSALPAIYQAMLLGEKSSLPHEQKAVFLQTGTMHLFAISGLHIGIIALALNMLLRIMGLKLKSRTATGILLLFIYVQVTGAKPSAMRAFIMVMVYWSALSMQKKKSPFSALLLSSIIVLILDPGQLWNPGFQLSYVVVCGILLYGLPLGEQIVFATRRDPSLPPLRMNGFFQRQFFKATKNLKMMLGVSIAATLVGTPLTILYFNIFTPGAILLSLILLPLASGTIFSAVLAILLGLLSFTQLSAFFNHGAWILLSLMEAAVWLFSGIPGFFFRLEFKDDIYGFVAIPMILVMLLFTHRTKYLGRPLVFLCPPVVLIVYLLAFTHPI